MSAGMSTGRVSLGSPATLGGKYHSGLDSDLSIRMKVGDDTAQHAFLPAHEQTQVIQASTTNGHILFASAGSTLIVVGVT